MRFKVTIASVSKRASINCGVETRGGSPRALSLFRISYRVKEMEQHAVLSLWHVILLLVIVLIFMGPGRIEKLGPSLGSALRGFKKGLAGDDEEKDETAKIADSETKKLQEKIERLERAIAGKTDPKKDDET
jgi:sec-independent protein translocase protein TatA